MNDEWVVDDLLFVLFLWLMFIGLFWVIYDQLDAYDYH